MRTTNYLTLSALVLGSAIAGCSSDSGGGTGPGQGGGVAATTGGIPNGGAAPTGGVANGGSNPISTGGSNVTNPTGGTNNVTQPTGGHANVGGGNPTGGNVTVSTGGNTGVTQPTGGKSNVGGGGNPTGGSGVTVSTGGSTGITQPTGGKSNVGGGGGGVATTGGSTGVTATGGSATAGSGNCTPGANVLSDFENTPNTSWQVYPVAAASGGAPAGIWYAYLDKTDGCSGQVPTVPASPATVMAGQAPATALPSGDSRASSCNKNAFHSSISGCQYYSGFGASLSPSSTVGSTLKNPIDFSNYDGISFWMKAGSGTQGPLYLEFVTKECVPSGDGGTATSTAVDEYNCHGHLLSTTDIPTTWTQKFIPFYTTGARWFPTATTGGSTQCPSGGLCEVPQLDTRHLLAIQFSLEDPFNKTPTAYPNYDVWIDDVALYKFSDTPANQGVATWTQSGASAFPANKTFTGCTIPKSADGKAADGRLLADAYVKWKANFVKADGSNMKVVSPEIDSGATVSEGIAYGMLIAVYMGDKALFDGLYGYWKANATAGSLMTWKIPGGTGSATDADEDAAFALLEASKQWTSGGYSPTTMLGDIWSHDIDASSLLPTGGSNYGSTSSKVTNASYFAPAMYKEFAKVDSGHNWTGVVSAVYTAINGSISGSNGLIPAWCSSNCTTSGSNGATTDTEYQYDSHRIPWRIGTDACWNGESKAATYLSKLVGFFNGKAGTGGLSSLYDIYQTSGTADTTNGANNSMSLVGCMGVGAMSVSSTSGQGGLAERAWQFLLEGQYCANYNFTNQVGSTKPGYTYYNATVGLLTGLMLSGNFYPM